MATFYVGETVRLTTRMLDTLARKLADPSGVTFSVKNPVTGQVSAYVFGTDSNVRRLSTGVYYADIVPDVAGKWAYRIHTTGAHDGAEEGIFEVAKSKFS